MYSRGLEQHQVSATSPPNQPWEAGESVPQIGERRCLFQPLMALNDEAVTGSHMAVAGLVANFYAVPYGIDRNLVV